MEDVLQMPGLRVPNFENAPAEKGGPQVTIRKFTLQTTKKSGDASWVPLDGVEYPAIELAVRAMIAADLARPDHLHRVVLL